MSLNNTLFDENAACHLALGMGFADTIKGFEAILGGECDNIPEQAFMLSGNIDSVYARSKEL